MQTETIQIEDRTTAAKRRWEEVWANPLQSKKNWQRMAALEALAVLALVALCWRLSERATQPALPYLLVTDKQHSYIQYGSIYKPQNMDAATWDAVKVQALTRFVESWRTVTSDASAQAQDWDRAFMFIGDGSQAKRAIGDWYAANDPIKKAQNSQLVTVQYKTFDREGDNTYGIWWQETTTTAAGQLISTNMWRARISYQMKVPTSAEAQAENKIGILITEISWEEVQ